MATSAAVLERPGRVGSGAPGSLARGVALGYLSVVVLLPLAALVWSSRAGGLGDFWGEVTRPEAVAALKLTLGVSAVCALVNAVAGTAIAWVLVRDRFKGKGIVDSVIDLPFALPTIVAGLTLLTLYGPFSPVGVHIAFTRASVVLALEVAGRPKTPLYVGSWSQWSRDPDRPAATGHQRAIGVDFN